VTTGTEGSTDLVTLSGIPFVAPDIDWENWRDGDGGNSSIQRFRQVIQKFRQVFSARGLVKSLLLADKLQDVM